jgi:hypothetical protein
MLLSHENRLSARICGHVLNYPLYDGDCSPAAPEYLAAGNIEGAISEWQRLADLGSGRARCVLAYLRFRGTPSTPADVMQAKRIALSAVAGERGHANYLLGWFALSELQMGAAVKYFIDSHKAGFTPAQTAMASLLIAGSGTSKERKQSAVNMFRRAAAAGHIPARLRLIRFYLSGQPGFTKRLVGVALLGPAFARFLLAFRCQIFSIRCFQYVAKPKRSLFNEDSILPLQQTGAAALPANRPYLAGLRWIHSLAAAIVAVVVVARTDFIAGRYPQRTDWTILGWVLLVVWPYGLSYLTARAINARSLISSLTQAFLLCLITAFACSAYAGHLLDFTLNAWGIGITAAAQATLLLMACGLGQVAAQQVQENDRLVPPYRRRVAWAHAILAFVAAGLRER